MFIVQLSVVIFSPSYAIVSLMISRRNLLMAPLPFSFAETLMGQTAASGKMVLSIHQNTSRAAGYRKSLEGWAKAGLKYVELTDVLLDDFLKTDTLDRKSVV